MIYPTFRDIFKSSLQDACHDYKYNMSKDVEQYLIRLCADDLLKTSASRPDGMVDSLIIFDALPNTKEATEYLKLNGDYYLTVAGYMPEAFCNKHTDFDYYLSVGKYSYYRLHQRISKDALFKTLSFDYMQIIFILNATFDSIKVSSDGDMIKAWECWKQTSHPIFRRKLVRMGLDTKESSD